MKILGIEGLDGDQLQKEIERGGTFVIYHYCISLLIITLRRSSNVYFLRGGEGGISKGLPFTLVSLLFGWWGFPWGPIHTIGSFITNFRGGKDVTREIVSSITKQS